MAKSTSNGDQFLTVKKERREYLGERYFRFNYQNDHVVQVCVGTGDVRKGKANSIGVYLIHKTTFFTNYMGMNYVEPITKKEFEAKFEQIVKILK